MRSLRVVLVVVAAAVLVLTVAALWNVGWQGGSTGRGGASSPPGMTNRNFNGEASPGSLPQSSLLDASGSPVDVRDLVRAAPVTLIVFFATYDTPWSDNVKVAKEIHRDMAKDGVLVLGIDEKESQGTTTAFVAKEGLTFRVVRDSNGSYLHSIGVPGSVEQMVVVDSTGNVLARRGRTSDSVKTIEEALRARTKQ